ncbi:aldehyde dehydrogenase family 3 member F1-like isoform X2 [Henckelia pumila]|uniref:aldehyde dehydrogenase family 3 member F1-like isoform X2 n=1 Tax=Henckelia pumila TaxID=405737 RepID=UPI003C6E33AB
MELDPMELELKELRDTFKSGRTKEGSWRKSQLKALLSFLEEKEDAILNALMQDLGKHPVEAYRDEIGPLIKTVNHALQNLKKWMSSKKIQLPVVAFPAKAVLVPEPLGVVLIISCWNVPFGAIAAGNAAVLKPSELAASSSSVLAHLMQTYLDSKAIKVIQGGPSVGEKLLQLKWDKIFFTGSKRVGRIVMSAAANNLTPVALELGGKCPAIVDSLSSSWDKKMAVKRIVSAKFGTCAAQACVAIDYILVEQKFAPALVELLKDEILSSIGENIKETNFMTKIVNKCHFSRLRNLLHEPNVEASIVYGGKLDEDNLLIEPTLLVDPPLKAGIMTEEIFGPLLPIITLEKIEDSIDFINSNPRALAIYGFTNDKNLMKRLSSETSSGSIVFNDAIIQYIAETAPFGGVGECGFGRYHGKFSFDMFTHEKTVANRGYLVDFWFRYPPWNEQKMWIFKSAYRFNYLGIVLIMLGLKKS